MAKIEIENLTKIFDGSGGEVVAVEDLDLTIPDGDFLVLVGPSGCGKSTTLRCIAGLETVTDGTITIGDQDITDAKPKNRDIAMVFQNYALYPHMTARENMSFGLKMTTDLPADEISRRVQDASEMLGIEDLLEKKPGSLSGGQQQRVALGRAIVREPEAFLMDEPLSNLDAKLRTQMRTELQDLQQKLGTSTIYVTHDQTEAMTMGDKIAILNQGKLQQLGTPLECYYQPQNQFVAGFIGSPSMNFFDVTYSDSDEQPTLNHEGFQYSISDELAEKLGAVKQSLVLGIRPESIEVTDSTDQNSFQVEVSVVEPLGERTLVYFDIDDETYIASLTTDILVNPGDTLNIVFPEENIHVFESDTGNSIHSSEPPSEGTPLVGSPSK
ncbi:sugar ABC transporter ATP-binding protein [Haloferax sp. Atlit-4N]|uniref:ABC transporter ATP-binding protein n=1 Tax=Haloferax sp. Atlit-4N TaxID=2077206 RepID=UPI000E28A368|nr:sn-glycerol-3-phosphate ABC transporter ATP-binding protein UgpC [Haloferax sp. Atlit-4N]RDZ51033.1 sugar ABC transporter ATP-binding protein [Haloferax sp. Atlit-4N]